MLLLPSCGGDKGPAPATASTRPSADRFAEVKAPTIPDATVPCPYDSTQLCNTDEETAEVIGGYDGALAEANRRIRWFCAWFGACKPE